MTTTSAEREAAERVLFETRFGAEEDQRRRDIRLLARAALSSPAPADWPMPGVPSQSAFTTHSTARNSEAVQRAAGKRRCACCGGSGWED